MPRRGGLRGKRALCSLPAILLGNAIAVPSLAHAAAHSTDVRTAQLRWFTVNDLFKLTKLGSYFGGPYAYSESTGALAVTILRPIDTDPSQRWTALGGPPWVHSNATGDIWVQLARGKPLTDITHGALDKSGWFSPQWSPDGVHLAMLSTRGGKLRLWTWSRLTGLLRPLSGDEVTFGWAEPGLVDLEQPYVWLNSRQILCTVLPKGRRHELPTMYGYAGGSQTPPLATAAWHRYLSGTQSTASVLDDLRATGPPPGGGDLALINLDGQKRVLTHNVNTLIWQTSPARDAVAFTYQLKAISNPSKYLNYLIADRGEWRLRVIAIDGRQIASTGDRAREVIPSSLRWSPDGVVLAYFGYAREAQIAPSLYLLNTRTDRVKAIALTGLNVSPSWVGHHPNPVAGYSLPELMWTGTGDLLVRGERMPQAARGRSTSSIREDWWLILLDGARRCLTCRLGSVPMSLSPEGGRERFFGLAAGRLWELDVSNGSSIDLTLQFHDSVAELVSPIPESDIVFAHSNRTVAPRTYNQVVFLSEDHGRIEPYLLDLRSHAIMALLPPQKGASVVSISAGGKCILYLKDDGSGLSLWRSNLNSADSALLFTANAFLRDITEAQLVHFPYTSLDGEKLNAWMLLPPGYRPGSRYPMITFIYPTYNFSAPAIPWQMTLEEGLSSENFLNMQIAAAHGYAVLFLSIPVAYGARDRVRVKVVNDVLPAVGGAVRRGFADPRRLAVWGHSYGGEAVMDLITRTNRFQAAIGSNGLSDLISAYGALNPQLRYSRWVDEDVQIQAVIESGELNLRGLPWQGWLTYVDNSPIFSVNRVHTPLLLTAGDLDFVPMQQSEEFFRALVRQGKPVRFVRYWGEGHTLTNPANIRDYWQQVFRWLNRYLPPANQKALGS